MKRRTVSMSELTWRRVHRKPLAEKIRILQRINPALVKAFSGFIDFAPKLNLQAISKGGAR